MKTIAGYLKEYIRTVEKRELALSALIGLAFFGIYAAMGWDGDPLYLIGLALVPLLIHALFSERLTSRYEITADGIQVIGWLGRRTIEFAKVRGLERSGFSILDLPRALLLVKPRSSVIVDQGSAWSSEAIWPERPDEFVAAANAAHRRAKTAAAGAAKAAAGARRDIPPADASAADASAAASRRRTARDAKPSAAEFVVGQGRAAHGAQGEGSDDCDILEPRPSHRKVLCDLYLRSNPLSRITGLYPARRKAGQNVTHGVIF